jgi:predicted SprT family Zn-dependent metalloprotease
MLSFSTRVCKVEQFARELLTEHGLYDWSFEFNRRKLQMGLCLFGLRQIALSVHFVEMNDDAAVRDTLLHEIAHALVGPGHGHDAVWKAKCREIGARPERLGYEVNMPIGRWHAICPGCGRMHSRHRRPKHMIGWHCSYCGRERGRLTWTQTGRGPLLHRPCGDVP